MLDQIQHYLNLIGIYDQSYENQSQEIVAEYHSFTQVKATDMAILQRDELIALYEAVKIGAVKDF